jgi:ATP synthase protein I
MRRLLLIQALAVLAAALLMSWRLGTDALPATLYGGGVALAASALLGWRQWQARRPLHADPARHLGALYRTALERWVLAGLLLAAGFTLGLAPLPLLAGFVLGQLVFLLSAGRAMHH